MVLAHRGKYGGGSVNSAPMRLEQLRQLQEIVKGIRQKYGLLL